MSTLVSATTSSRPSEVRSTPATRPEVSPRSALGADRCREAPPRSLPCPHPLSLLVLSACCARSHPVCTPRTPGTAPVRRGTSEFPRPTLVCAEHGEQVLRLPS